MSEVERMAQVIYEASDNYAEEGVEWENQHGSPANEARRQAEALQRLKREASK